MRWGRSGRFNRDDNAADGRDSGGYSDDVLE